MSVVFALFGLLAVYAFVARTCYSHGHKRGHESGFDAGLVDSLPREIAAWKNGHAEGRVDERIAFERGLRESAESAVRHLTAMAVYASRGKPNEAIGLLVVAISTLADNTTQPLAVHQTAIDLLRSVIAQSDGVPKVVRA